MSPTQITVQASIKGELAKVWNYYTDPGHIIHWNYADASWHCPDAKNDLRPGGTYYARMEAKDGREGFDFEAVYTEVVDHEKLSYVMTDGRKVDVIFHELQDETLVEVTFDAETENPVEMQRAGWQSILNNFKTYVEIH